MNLTAATFTGMCVAAKPPMPLSRAADCIRDIRRKELPRPVRTWRFNSDEARRAEALKIACDEAESALRSAPPWQDWREIFASLEWPYARRIIRHARDQRYSGVYGEKELKADTWFMDMWKAWHDLFRAMPGGLPDNRAWQMFGALMNRLGQDL